MYFCSLTVINSSSNFSEAFSGSVDKSTVDHDGGALPAISEGIQQQQGAQGFPGQCVCGIH